MINFMLDENKMMGEMQQISSMAGVNGSSKPLAKEVENGFKEYLKEAIESVDHQQVSAEKIEERYLHQDPNVSLSQVMVQVQKAEVSLTSVVEVRNKIIDGYKSIMNLSM